MFKNRLLLLFPPSTLIHERAISIVRCELKFFPKFRSTSILDRSFCEVRSKVNDQKRWKWTAIEMNGQVKMNDSQKKDGLRDVHSTKSLRSGSVKMNGSEVSIIIIILWHYIVKVDGLFITSYRHLWLRCGLDEKSNGS